MPSGFEMNYCFLLAIFQLLNAEFGSTAYDTIPTLQKENIDNSSIVNIQIYMDEKLI